MVGADAWKTRRSATAIAVLALHAVLCLLLLWWPPTGRLPAPVAQPIELLLLPPAVAPPAISQNDPLRRQTGPAAITVTPPQLPSTDLSPPQSTTDGPSSNSDGQSSGVDWAAEAHRAIQAFEIRNHQPPLDVSLSNSPAEEQWWPRTRHQAGDKFKTANGDWIVWVSANCYQVASADWHRNAADAAPQSSVCMESGHQTFPQ